MEPASEPRTIEVRRSSALKKKREQYISVCDIQNDQGGTANQGGTAEVLRSLCRDWKGFFVVLSCPSRSRKQEITVLRKGERSWQKRRN